MVYSKLCNISRYISEDNYKCIKEFVESINPEMEERLYSLNGDEIYARVMSYTTPEPGECKIEAHNRYIDIQSTIVGAEGISVFDRSMLIEATPYSKEEDVAFFRFSEDALRAHTINVPGYFTMLFPEDAHRPQEMVNGFGRVKKFVIKIKI